MNLQHPSHYQILALSGSLRRGSYNRKLLEAAVRCTPSGFRVELFDGLADVPPFNEDTEAIEPLHHGARHLREAVAGADGLLIATPEYNQSIPGFLKNAIDWLSRPLPGDILAGKPIAVLGASTGRWGTRLAQAALRQTLTAVEAQVMPAPMLFIAGAGTLFNANNELCDAATLSSLRMFMDAFAHWLGRADTRSLHGAA